MAYFALTSTVPTDISLWTWLFDSPHSKLQTPDGDTSRGFTNVDTGEHIDYREIKHLTTQLSTAFFTQCGLEPGDAIIVFSKNTVWYPVAMLSAMRVGIIACGVSPDYNDDELAYAVKTSKAKLIVTTPDRADKARLAARKAQILDSSVVLLDTEQEPSLKSLIRSVKNQRQVGPFQIPRGKSNGDVCAYYGFSSGTTGLPKAVMISHANVMAQCLQIQQITPSSHDRILAALPFYHITGVVHQLHLPVLLNANVFILPTFTLEQMLDTVAKYKIRELLLVPPILIRMVREADLLRKYDLRHVERFSSGAAPLSQEILTLLENLFPGTGFKQGYGMTESCSCITAHPPEKYAYKYAARVGAVVASTEVRVVDPDTGKDCGVDQAGEIWARGPQIAMGYLNNAKATKETFDSDGFLHTGDIGKFDDEGMLSITDRLKEMVKVKGIGVAPAELENHLLGHPAVDDCAVVGVQDDRAGERPKAFVVLKPPYDTKARETAQELLDFVRKNKTRHKWIKEVEVIAQIPKSPAGKILRKILRQSHHGPGNVFVKDRPDSKL